jgi:hypothetical protein
MLQKLMKPFYKEFVVMANERALLFRSGRAVSVLRSGSVQIWDPFNRFSIEYFPITGPAFRYRLAQLSQTEAGHFASAGGNVSISARPIVSGWFSTA